MSDTDGGSGGEERVAPPERGAGLTDQDRAVLAFAARGWPSPGAKERAIRERLGMSPVRYYQLLNWLLDDQAALAYDPVTVNRLRRARQHSRDRTR
ncbi:MULTISPECIES: DUF3263 domain-containing protein [unclassified Streptomyces]|uniref:DUF3263 domain-containing protein n=1 Tax=unclassified Streptomyces TaxID=2593676 RepID=UPI002DDA26B7|nr:MULTISPECIES: DUF3263 domain-containing protein [unclassified Streptomyces]WSA93949.1 DUF3263 domain-containing protein [Streptomyces sp. NBC_01795]WSB78375.1 DUF3263 domain-containing protein [Streptomyces sp. NBC_01775]WSS13422.1 DUF3263 domain-containing protein [Streptomyces sp. NBC_01186]WSS42211.1 DUF3263 domain-containing protein [Streptomyces sp. NBC_01187]